MVGSCIILTVRNSSFYNLFCTNYSIEVSKGILRAEAIEILIIFCSINYILKSFLIYRKHSTNIFNFVLVDAQTMT